MLWRFVTPTDPDDRLKENTARFMHTPLNNRLLRLPGRFGAGGQRTSAKYPMLQTEHRCGFSGLLVAWRSAPALESAQITTAPQSQVVAGKC